MPRRPIRTDRTNVRYIAGQAVANLAVAAASSAVVVIVCIAAVWCARLALGL